MGKGGGRFDGYSSGEKYTEICRRKNKKEFANDLKTIYQAPSEKAALEQLERVTEKWEKDYPNAMKSRHTNRDVISPIFKFSARVRKVNTLPMPLKALTAAIAV